MHRPPPEPRRKAPPLPRLVVESLRIARAAGPREVRDLFVLQAATVVLVIAEVLVARNLATELVDSQGSGAGVGTLVPDLVGLVLLAAALAIANAVQLHRQRILADLCGRRGEDAVVAVTRSVELATFDDPEFHDMVERAQAAVLRLPTVITNLAGLLRAAAGAIGAVVGLIALEPLFAPAVVLVLIPTWLAARQRGRVFYGFAHRFTAHDRERRYLAALLMDREAAKEVRAYALGRFLDERRGVRWDERLGELRTVAGRQLVVTVVADVIGAAIVGATLVALVALTLSGDVSLGSAGVIAATVVLLGQRLTLAASSSGNLSETALYVDDYLALIERGAADAEPGGGAPREPLHVRAEGVGFSYAGARGPALRDVSLEIAPGEVVALVGENGSGKTTLAKLLAGLYLPGDGRVTWNGSPTDGPDRERMRGGVAVVFQDFMHYALAAEDNIGLGRHERLPDPEGIREAARRAGAHDDIERLPDGYGTVLDPVFAGGTDLSTGQWQRVALARAVFRDAPFVILDEPTAALDAQAEHDLFASIRELLSGRSVLLISHRFSSVREADRIHVLHRGEIVESGTHDQLIERGGRYARLFELQATPYR